MKVTTEEWLQASEDDLLAAKTLVMEINKEFGNGRIKQKYIQLSPRADESIPEFCARISDQLDNKKFQIIKASCFGSLKYQEEVEGKLKALTGGNFPVTWVEGENCSDSFMNGIQLWAVDAPVKYLSTGFHAIGSLFEDEHANYLFVGDCLSSSAKGTASGYSSLLSSLDQFLKKQDFSFGHVVRTWYYLDDILSWYDEFNQIRSDYFKDRGISVPLFPASTGVGGRNKMGSGVAMDLLAVKPKNRELVVSKVISPLQNEANDYGSSFSRAIRVQTNGSWYLSISGTASILQNGETAHIGDFEAQIKYSFRVIEKILQQEKYEFRDIVRATAYLKDKSSTPGLIRWMADNTGFQIPLIISENTICRDNLLFELEMDLVKT